MSYVLDIRFEREIYNRVRYGIRKRPCSSLLRHQGLYQVCITEVMSSGNVTDSTVREYNDDNK